MAKPTLSEISKLFKTDDKPTDFHYYGTVVSADVENRTYEVSINRDKNITVEAARLVGAHVGDTVMVTVMANGYATVTGRVGGDTDASDAQRKADSASTIADQAQTKAISALNTATEADQLANQAKQLADQAERNASRSADAADESERQADLSRQAAQASAQQADLSRQAADLSAQNALGSKISADAAQEAAEAAQDAAEDAQSASESARDRAISAEGYAQQANTHATQAETYAGQALSSAETANTAANSAITQLGVVQDVVGVLDWVSTHATYKTSSDTSVVAGKMYFTKSGNTYTLVVNPTGNPSTQGYYEIDSIDEAVTNYVTSHLALTNDGLWVTKDNNGYKILVSNTGVKIYDPQGILVSTFGESISFSSTRPQKIGNDNQYIEYYNDNGTYKVRIVADNITLGGSNVATTLSNLAAADTAQTNAFNAYKTSNDAAVSSLNTHISDTDTDLANYITSNNQAIENLQGQIDGSIQTWFYEVVPTNNNPPAVNWTTTELKNNHLGDLYYDTITGYCYRYQVQNNIYGWQRITDVDVTKALADAAKAQDTADHKRRVFVVEPTPPYDVGDLWVQGQNGDIKRCATAKTSQQTYSASDWTLASKYTDDSAVTALAGNVYTKSEVYTKQNIDTKIGEINTTITSKETTIKQYADTKASTAESNAKTYADGKASTAESNAKTAAAADATSKANAAKQAAIDDAASKYYNKTETYTKSEIEQKAGEISLSVAQEEVEKVISVKEASGNIVHVEDASEYPALSLKVHINPKQDLHGYDHPWTGGAGKNKLDESTFTSNDTFAEINGVFSNASTDPRNYFSAVVRGYHSDDTFEDMSITPFSATGRRAFPTFTPQADIVRIAILHSGSQLNLECYFDCQLKSGQTYNASLNIIGFNPQTVGGLSFDKIQIETGSTATAYEPYSNICPISGWDAIEAYRTGINVWDEEWEVGTIKWETGVNDPSSTSGRSKNYISAFPNTTYHLKTDGNNANVFYYDGDKALVGKNFVSGSGNGNFTTPSGTAYIRLAMYSTYGTTYNNDISINYPSTDHEYHAYNGHTTTTALPETVYGGTLDVVNGVLTVDRAMVDLGTLDWIRNTNTHKTYFQTATEVSDMKKSTGNLYIQPILCSNYEAESWSHALDNDAYDGVICEGWANKSYIAIADSTKVNLDAPAFKTAMDGVQLCYELAEPRTIQLAPKQVTTLLGTNNVWADSGDVDLKYVTMNSDMNALMNKSNADLKITADGISSEVSKISSAKYVVSANGSGWSLANLKIWAAEGYTTNWNVATGSTDNLRVGDVVYIKGTDTTRQCPVYIKVTVDAINSTSQIRATAHGYEDVLPVETIKSTINQSADSVKIAANHVDIEGAAIFHNTGRLSQTSLNANYAANTAAMSRTQRIYYRSDSSTLPNPPTENNKGKWFEPTQSDTGYNTWSRDIVPLIGGFHYLFMCDQTQTAAQYVAGNECTNSSVMRDDSTSVIDGGSITTGRINANYIDASTLQIGYGQVDGLGEFMSLMTFKDGVLRIAKPGSRFAVELSDDGLFFKQNDTAVSYINMNRLYIPYAVVLDQMMIGKEENNSLWAWTSEEDGSLTLKWIGGNN